MTQTGANIEAENSLELFSDLSISQELKQGVKELGYTAPTVFQRGVLNNFLLGKNIVGEGRSNYGKSLAFSLPILSKIDPQKGHAQALIICETALQSEICLKECKALGRHLNVEVGNAQSIMTDTLLHIAAIAVADLSKLDPNKISSLSTVFFDGLSKESARAAINKLSDILPDVQILIYGEDTLLAFKEHVSNLIDNAVFISNQDQPRITMPAKHIFHQPKEAEPKPRALLAALEVHNPKNSLVTCNDAEECELLAKYLSRYGYKTLVATSDSQNFGQSLRLLLQGSADVLLCQNSLIDGHSLENVSLMINYDMFDRPQSYEETTQFKKQAAGLERTIVNILTSRELGYLGPIKAQCLIEFTEMPLPSEEEVLGLAAKRILLAIKNEASFVELGQYEMLAKKILESSDASVALSLLLRNHFSQKPQAAESEHRDRSRYSREPRQHGRERERDSRPRSEEPRENRPENTGITRLYITLGRQDKFNDLASLAQYLSEKSSVDLGHFSGSGMIRDNSAHIEVDDDVAETIIAALNGTPRPHAEASEGENNVICERARQNQRPAFRRPPPRRRPNFQRRDR